MRHIVMEFTVDNQPKRLMVVQKGRAGVNPVRKIKEMMNLVPDGEVTTYYLNNFEYKSPTIPFEKSKAGKRLAYARKFNDGKIIYPENATYAPDKTVSSDPTLEDYAREKGWDVLDMDDYLRGEK